MKKKNRKIVAKRLWAKQKEDCFYCNQRMKLYANKSKNRLGFTLDHVWPISRGGAKGITLNCVAACNACNSSKADRLPSDQELERFYSIYGFYPLLANGEQRKRPKRSGLKGLLIRANARLLKLQGVFK